MDRGTVMDEMQKQTQAVLQRNQDVIHDWTHGIESTLEDYPLEDYLQGKGYQEDSQEDLQVELSEIRRNPKHPYFVGNGPDHDAAVQHVNNLLAKIKEHRKNL